MNVTKLWATVAVLTYFVLISQFVSLWLRLDILIGMDLGNYFMVTQWIVLLIGSAAGCITLFQGLRPKSPRKVKMVEENYGDGESDYQEPTGTQPILTLVEEPIWREPISRQPKRELSKGEVQEQLRVLSILLQGDQSM